MKGTTIAALGVMVLGSAGVIAWKFVAPILEKRALMETSDAVKSKATISVGVDNFLGYYILCSPYQRSQMRNAAYELRCIDDDADYGKRMERLRKGEIQLAVATIDSYELNAVETKFPGLIVAVIDRSNGADAIVVRASKVKNIDDLKRGGLKVAFAVGSPSEHLLKVISTDFDIPQWRSADKSWRVEVKNSQEAAKRFAAGDVDVAVLWEPDVTKMLRSNPDAIKVIGTEVAPRAIVDVLLARREFVRSNREAVKSLLQSYFKSVYYYRTNPDTAAVKHAPEYGVLDLNAVVDEALLFIRHDIEANSIALSAKFAADLPEVLGDRIQLQQVIVNLLVNSIQAVAQGNGSLRRINLGTNAEPDGTVTFSIRDSGPGIAAQDLDRVFDCFFSTKADGMGVGLAVCQSIIMAHGGSINVSNHPDGGARFRFSLPARLAYPLGPEASQYSAATTA